MKKQFVSIVLVLASLSVSAQRLKTQEGDFKNLKGIDTYSLVFDYTDVQIPKFDNEEAFLKDKMDKREEKKAGDGERFKNDWFNDRPDKYHPKFIESFNKRFDDNELSVSEDAAEYTMKIHTTKIYPGYNVGIVRHNAEIDATVIIYETGNENNILFSGSYRDVQGSGAMGYDYNSGYRISECYAKLAKNMAKEFNKRVL
ncbi:hypothetical protein PP182_02925 [Maribacter sp. PR1]|uniref:DUF4136 domain-containing protein n=1 Tax=Maribacter cobaltidurans TaxID=1178778 RepID=A0ABU7IPX5_9FLAO|nr:MULTISPECIES: hypothetical protein [Maribacter]MDC6387618.1 hypothetical protein [Maribacter sp. PR1]MEE1975006.1 hypothetical protein [Maribacter cobaltidurans]